MLSLKFYQCCIKPKLCIEFFRKNLLSVKNRGLSNVVRNFRANRLPRNTNNLKGFFTIGIGGSLATYLSCAIWEFESSKAFNKPKKSIFIQLFIKIFRRPPKSEDVFWIIAGLNVLVHIMLRAPHKFSSMSSYFPLSTSSSPISLFLSMFTHFELFHMAINLYVLHSFCPLINYFGAPHFMAIYLSGGLLSGLGSILYKGAKGIALPSVGASGAIMTILGMFASMNPDLRFGIPVISDFTKFSFSAHSAIIGIMTFDLCGLLFFKNSRFDHVCHLAGITFGIFYGLMGKSLIWDTRQTWMSWYYHGRHT